MFSQLWNCRICSAFEKHRKWKNVWGNGRAHRMETTATLKRQWDSRVRTAEGVKGGKWEQQRSQNVPSSVDCFACYVFKASGKYVFHKPSLSSLLLQELSSSLMWVNFARRQVYWETVLTIGSNIPGQLNAGRKGFMRIEELWKNAKWREAYLVPGQIVPQLCAFSI